MKQGNYWLAFVVIHVIFIGVWGALIEIPEKNGFPSTLGYVVWALCMVPAALVALKINGWKMTLSKPAAVLGMLVGLLGAGGQLVLFYVLRVVPAYLVFPVLSLTPVVTILLAAVFLKERTTFLGWIGIGLAVVAIVLLSYQPQGQPGGTGLTWLLLSAIPLVAWGAQGFAMRWANKVSNAETIFVYMTISSLLFIPAALYMTDFSRPVNWGAGGPLLAAGVQMLNAIGALCLVYAFRYGKAIFIAPMTTALSPVLTVIISLLIYAVVPHTMIVAGILLAVTSAVLMVLEEGKADQLQVQH
ncbi:EamA family transporter [Chitinophaga alhagiae]|uniref:EamA family transporter n=1 Tax=Chitinophaga alhagiae TaxID=2203219 RepID=A0ABM6WAF8_9BACT|nr:DMT family transporter [Chitinophaga alhagiae]AWO00861.1 EamA family transporter [Chitinophaga alhagiae]